MKISNLKDVLYNQHGCAFQNTLLWRFDESGSVDEYYEGVHENVIATHGDKEVKRIQAEIDPKTNVARIVIETN
jgi:hypothetical protein